MTRRWLGAMAIAIAAVLTAGAGAAHASSCDYNGAAGGDWHQAGNWTCIPADPDGIPDGDDSVSLSTGDDVLITGQDEAAASLSIANGATLEFANSSTLAANGALTKSSTNTLSITGSTVRLSGDSSWLDGTICLNTGSTLRVQAI